MMGLLVFLLGVSFIWALGKEMHERLLLQKQAYDLATEVMQKLRKEMR